MKLKEVLITEAPPMSDKDYESKWNQGAEQNDRFKTGDGQPMTSSNTKGYWVKGKNKEGKDRRWGPFKSSDEARKFQSSRTDIRNGKIVMEEIKE